MDLVVHEVVQLHHVDVAHRHLAIERLAGASVVQNDLTGVVKAGEIEHVLDVRLLGAVEHRSGHRHAVPQVTRELDQLLLAQRLDRLVVAVHALERILERPQIALGVIGVDRLADALAEAGAGPTEMGLENLPHVHAARHAQRIEHNIDRRAVFEERHVLHRHDLRHHALVPVAARHLVAGLDLALHRDEDFHHLHHARRQLVAALQLFHLVEEALLEPLLALLVLLADRLDLRHHLVVRRGELPPLRARILLQHRLGDLGVLLETFRPGDPDAALQHLGEPPIDVAVQNRLLVVAVLGQPLDFLALDGKRALVLFHAVAVEHPHFDHRAMHARRHAQRGIAHVGGFFAKDGAQEFLLRRHRAFALGRDLAHQNIAGAHFGADVHDARLIQVLQRLLRDVGDVAGDFFGPELGVARHHLEFLDMNRGEHVVLHDPLGQQDRVLEVVAVPRHERDQHVAPERELAQVGRRTVGDDVALADVVADLHQRPLVDAGRLVRALELLQPVDVDARLGRIRFVGGANDDTGCIHLVDDTGAPGHDGGARIPRHDALHAGADIGRLGADQRHRLPLHVRAHQRAVGVVVFQERNQRRRHRHKLLG